MDKHILRIHMLKKTISCCIIIFVLIYLIFHYLIELNINILVKQIQKRHISILHQDIMINHHISIINNKNKDINTIYNKILYLSSKNSNSKYYKDLAIAIYENSKIYNINPDLLISLIYTESTFKKYAKNINSVEVSLGYCQINTKVHNVDINKIYDEMYNVSKGSKLLYQYIDKYKDKKQALASYNAGPGGVMKGYGFDYADKVLKTYNNLKQLNI